MINLQDIDLPIIDIIDRIQETLEHQNTIIIGAPPGAGKSTILPLIFTDIIQSDQKILMLEPRRLAAISIANRMSELANTKVGEEIGYRIRFDTKVSSSTRIEVITEGILTRIIQNDNELSGVGMIIFDEFHERNINADLALDLCREAQKVLRPDLKIVIMSATLDMPKLSELLDSPIIESKGRQYPVDIKYAGQSDIRMLSELTAEVVKRASIENGGDILVFLPGQAEIKRCQGILSKSLRNFQIHPLYGMLNKNKQWAAIHPDKNGIRKVVLATSIAETSLTIEGVTTVVDSGFTRNSKFDPNSGLSRLETDRISRDSADQRAGRAGRLGPGVCYRMWSQADHLRLAESREPEILNIDLSSLILELYNWGIRDMANMDWLDMPKKGNIDSAIEMLKSIEAIDDKGITDLGKQIQKIPAHPRIAKMLLLSKNEGLTALGCDLAAILEDRDPMSDAGIDINIRIEGLRKFRNDGNNKGRFSNIARVAASYLRFFQTKEDNEAINPLDTGYLLANTYPERIAHSRPGNNAQFQLANGRYASAGHKDDLAFEQWLVIANMDARSGMGKIFLASPLNPQDLAPLVNQQNVLTWNDDKGLVSTTDMRIGNIILQSKPNPNFDPKQALQIIIEKIETQGSRLLNFNDGVIQFQNKVTSLNAWNNEAWPDFRTAALLEDLSWLMPYLDNVLTFQQIENLDILEILKNSLDYNQQQKLNRLAPSKYKVPSGSEIKINYNADASVPILAVRIQELFGLKDSPKINENRTSLKLHLLSPGYKPVQVTSDLTSFWANTYQEVKKELKGRYPKHYWPENPLEAEPTRRAKPRKK